MIHDQYKSPNFSRRHQRIDTIVLHHTGGAFPGCAIWLCDPDSRVSAHYIVTRDGVTYCLVDDKDKAWHAGKSAWDYDKDEIITAEERVLNDRSIGIELEAYSPYNYPTRQIQALDKLVVQQCRKHRINAINVLGHKEIAPGRKVDPAEFNMGLYRAKISVALGEDYVV